jgi:hypothetical protein
MRFSVFVFVTLLSLASPASPATFAIGVASVFDGTRSATEVVDLDSSEDVYAGAAEAALAGPGPAATSRAIVDAETGKLRTYVARDAASAGAGTASAFSEIAANSYTPYPEGNARINYRLDFDWKWDLRVEGAAGPGQTIFAVDTVCNYGCDRYTRFDPWSEAAPGATATAGRRTGTLYVGSTYLDYHQLIVSAGARITDPAVTGTMRAAYILRWYTERDADADYFAIGAEAPLPRFLSQPAPVPLPFAAPLLVAGVAALGLAGARRRRLGARAAA